MAGGDDRREQRSLFKSEAAPADEQTLAGTLGRTVFSNEETGFKIARLDTEAGEATVLGEVLSQFNEGALVQRRGRWVEDRRFGRQFKVSGGSERPPETLLGIERFLGSAKIDGIGPELARRLVAHFGMK